jgi:hypothetical protein
LFYLAADDSDFDDFPLIVLGDFLNDIEGGLKI